jgi:hypothetical protein
MENTQDSSFSIDRTFRHDELYEALNSLAAEYRTCIILFEIAGFSLKEGKEVNFEIETEIYTDLGEERIQWAVIKSPINRLEIINHTSNEHPIGRIFTYHGNVEINMQDGGTCLKVFI